VAITHLSVITPATTKFDGDVTLVIAPGTAGDLGALAQHAPLLTTMRVGVVKANAAVKVGAVAKAGAADKPDAEVSEAIVGEAVAAADATLSRIEFAVDGGFMEVLPDKVIILTDAALSRDEIDIEATRAELRRAEEALAQKRGADDAAERRAVAWANAKLEVRRVPKVE